MIIQALLDLIYSVFSLLTMPIDIPDLPASVNTVLTSAIEYITAGAAIVARFCNYQYLMVLFGLVLAVDVGINLYKFVMFIIKKIPFLGMQ